MIFIVITMLISQTGCTPNSINELENYYNKYKTYFSQAIEICNRYPEFKEVRMENSLIGKILNRHTSDDPSYVSVGMIEIGKYHNKEGDLVTFDTNKIELFVTEIEPIFKKLNIMVIESYSDDRIEIISHTRIRGAYGWIYMRNGVLLPDNKFTPEKKQINKYWYAVRQT